MDPLTIAGLVTSIGGAALQYKASSDAAKRQSEAIQQSLARQRELQMKAESMALSRAQEYETPKRAQEQAQLEDQITETLAAPVSESQQIRSQQQTTQGNVSDEYTTAKAKSDLEAMKSMQTMARLLGKTTSASRLRMNEGIRMVDTGMGIDQLNNFSRGQDRADQFAIEQAGKLDPGKVFFGALARGVGSAGMMLNDDLTVMGAAAKYGAGDQQAAMLAAQEAGMGTGGLWNATAKFRDGYNSFMRGFQ